MNQILKNLGPISKLLLRNKFLYFVALMGVLTFSAFSSRPENSPSFEEATSLPPDSLGNIDIEGAKKLRKAIRFNHLSDSLISYALSLEGKPYRYGGKDLKGFDCSGFVYHVFNRFGINLNRSSRTMVVHGDPVEVEQVQKGDLLFFTGTNPQKREIGHVGIVITEPGEEIRFVHSSSNGGVKISQLEGYYETRFMEAKRLLGEE